MMQDIMDLARYRWPSILSTLGMPNQYLRDRHGPCPVCQGAGFENKRPYRFDDKWGNGDHYCTHHRARDGMWLACEFFGWSFREAADIIRDIIGGCKMTEPKTEEKDVEKIKAGIKKIWGEAKFPDVVHRYMISRSLSVVSPALRGHQFLPYKHDDGSITKEKAMVALVQNKDGKVTTVHRTFLFEDGNRVKKLYKTVSDTWLGGAVRLYPFDKEKAGFIAIAEGIETALSVRQMYEQKGLDAPVWAACTAGGMEAWQPPDGVERVSIFGDADPSFVGQKAAYVLAERLARNGIQTEVHIPKHGDWLDFLVAMQGREAA